MMNPQDLLPIALLSGASEARWYLGTLIVVKATGAQTGGAFGLIE